MAVGFRADLKDSRTSSEEACPINGEFKYLTVTLLLTSPNICILNSSVLF